jgi:hypothetical protein
MRSKFFKWLNGFSAVAIACALAACAQAPSSSDHAAHSHGGARDTRQFVKFPDEMRIGTLANMRDHLLALSEIQGALADERYVAAADIAENRLGMSSLKLHGAHDVSRFMPQGMQDTGTAMHRSASRFAIAAQNSAATGDAKPALAALTEVTRTCVACHASYRIQ